MKMEQILSLLRTALKFGGGFLVAKGYIGDAALTAGIGAVVTLVGVVWSAFTHSDYTPPAS